jgi:hypothetical protein
LDNRNIFILGTEYHTEGGVDVADNTGTLYKYNSVTNILTKLNGTSYIAMQNVVNNYQYFEFDTYVAAYIGSDNGTPIIIYYVSLKPNGAYPEPLNYSTSLIILNGLTNSLIYDSIGSGDYYLYRDDFPTGYYSVVVDRVMAVETLNNSINLAFNRLMNFDTTYLNIEFNDPTDFSDGLILHVPLHNSRFARISMGSIHFWGDTPEKCVIGPDPIYPGELRLLRAESFFTQAFAAYTKGTSLLCAGKSSTYYGLEDEPDYSSRKIMTFTGEIKYSKGPVFDLSLAGSPTCSLEMYPDGEYREVYWLGYYWSDNERISAQSRYALNSFREGQTCIPAPTLPGWEAFTPIKYTTTYFRGAAYIENTNNLITFWYTKYPDDVWGILTFYGMNSSWMGSIKKYPLDMPIVRKAYVIKSKLFIQSFPTFAGHGILMYVPLEGYLEAEPTSITTDSTKLFIGGKTLVETVTSGVYFDHLGNPVTPDIAFSGFLSSPLALTFTIPEMLVSGVYEVDYNHIIPDNSGCAYVKLYGTDALVYGNIAPYSLIKFNTNYFEDLSGTLPSGTCATSIDIGTDVYMCTELGKIYRTTDLSTWELYHSGNPISTSILTYEDDFYVATPTGADSLLRTITLDTPNFTAADTGLPSGINILDIEEEVYSDR